MRRIAMLSLATGMLAAAAPARAQLPGTGGTTGTTTTTTGTGLTAADFLIRIEHKDSKGGWTWLQNGTAEFTRFFTRARCLCDEELRIRVDFQASGQGKTTPSTQGTLKVLVGPTTACVASSATDRTTANCFFPAANVRFNQAGSTPEAMTGSQVNLSALKYSAYEVPVTMRRLFQPLADRPTADGCSTDTQQSIYLFVDTAKNGSPDPGLVDSSAPVLQLPIDGLPPPQPENVVVRSGGNALAVSWDQLSGVPDFAGGGFVVFCARGGTLPVFADPQYTGAYASSDLLCPAPGSTDAGADASTTQALTSISLPLTVTRAAQAASGDAGATDAADAAERGGPEDGTLVAPPAAFTNTNPAFQCTPLLTTGTSARIEGLENDIPYVIGVAAVDKTGNASPITKAYLQTPIATRDFYAGYRKDGGAAAGGYCAVGGRGSRSVAALAILAAVALVWRRQRGRKVR
jgi:hypothetical protein